MNKITLFGIALALFLALISLASALTINTISSPQLAPGKPASISISVENTLSGDIEDVSFSLQLGNTKFITVGSSEDSIDEIREGREKSFGFTLQPAYDIEPGDYSIPYTLTYTYQGERQPVRQGSIGVSVIAQPELSFALSEETPVLNQKGSVTLRIINNGLANARFVSIKVLPDGFTLLSDNQVYIGTVDSDDFESTSFDVVFTKEDPLFSALIEYRDLNNKIVTQTVTLPFTVYTPEEAKRIGLVQSSPVPYYVGALVVIALLWFIWRSFRKRRRMKARTEQH